MTFKGPHQTYPAHPERFDRVVQVLCRESLTGRCYWEVEFSMEDVDIAVSYKGISRKGGYYESRFGFNNQSWSLICSGSRFSFRHNSEKSKLPEIGRESCRERVLRVL